MWYIVTGGHACTVILQLNAIPRFYNKLPDKYLENLKLPDNTHDSWVTSAHSTDYAAALNICRDGFIRV